jgi:hypothetical protein
VQPFAALEDGKEVLRVGQLTEVDRVTEPLEPARGRSGREAEQIPACAPPALEHDVTTLEVELGDPCTQKELDPKLAILLARSQSEAVSRHRAEQEAFREVWTLVWDFCFGAGEQDLALKARVAQARSGGVPGGTTADDYRFLDSSRTRSSDQARYPPSTAIAKA